MWRRGTRRVTIEPNQLERRLQRAYLSLARSIFIRFDNQCQETIPLRPQTGTTPLHYAVMDGSLDTIHALLAAGAATDARDKVRPMRRSSIYGRESS